MIVTRFHDGDESSDAASPKRIVKGIVSVVLVISTVSVLAIGLVTISSEQKGYADASKEVSHVAEEVAPKQVTVNLSESSWVDQNLLRKIDFDTLTKRNADARTWLYVPGTGLDAPVMSEKSVGQYYYDLRGIDKRYNGYGSFLIPASPDGADDYRTLILGHKMAGYYGSQDWQFAQLPIRWATREGAESYPYIYTYTSDGVATRWRVWAGVDAHADSVLYDLPATRDSDIYKDSIAYCQNHARYTIGEAPTPDRRSLVLSTCNRAAGGAWQRFALVCVEDAVVDADGVYHDRDDEMAAWHLTNGAIAAMGVSVNVEG